MARDMVANFVYRLLERGFDPRRVGPDAWESRCPGHNSSDHALSITHDVVYGVNLHCRTSHNCRYGLIRRALVLIGPDRETPEEVLRRLSAMEIEPSSFHASDAGENQSAASSSLPQAAGSAALPPPPVENAMPHIPGMTVGGEDAAIDNVEEIDLTSIRAESTRAIAGGDPASASGDECDEHARGHEGTAVDPSGGARLAHFRHNSTQLHPPGRDHLGGSHGPRCRRRSRRPGGHHQRISG